MYLSHDYLLNIYLIILKRSTNINIFNSFKDLYVNLKEYTVNYKDNLYLMSLHSVTKFMTMIGVSKNGGIHCVLLIHSSLIMST